MCANIDNFSQGEVVNFYERYSEREHPIQTFEALVSSTRTSHQQGIEMAATLHDFVHFYVQELYHDKMHENVTIAV